MQHEKQDRFNAKSAGTNESYASILKEIMASTKELIRNELLLVKEEATLTAGRLAAHSAQAALFGALVALSVLPFLAFLVIGLGEIMGGRYWLSSLLVSLVCAGVGGTMTYLSFKKIKEQDLKLPRTRETLVREAEVINAEIDHVRKATKRRAV
jgi:hypothetical protein